MGSQFGILDRYLTQRVLRRWTGAAQAAETAELSQLREQRDVAKRLRGRLDRLLHVAEDRLALPRVGSNVFSKPVGTKWSWRPAMWRGPVSPKAVVGVEPGEALGPSVKVFHDCPKEEMTFRQLRNTREEDLAAFGLQLDVLGFQGSFVSLVIDLPDDAAEGLRKRDIMQVHMVLEAERPMGLFARLNIKCGPNAEQLVQEVPAGQRDAIVDFDLAYANVAENRVDALWLDLILDDPGMNQLRLRDLTFCRYPRAEM